MNFPALSGKDSKALAPFGRLAIADIGDAFIPSAFDLESVAAESEAFFARLARGQSVTADTDADGSSIG